MPQSDSPAPAALAAGAGSPLRSPNVAKQGGDGLWPTNWSLLHTAHERAQPGSEIERTYACPRVPPTADHADLGNARRVIQSRSLVPCCRFLPPRALRGDPRPLPPR